MTKRISGAKERRSYSIRALRAVEGFMGSRAAVAKALKVSQACIDSWVRNNRVSSRFALDLSKLIDGKFSAEEFLGSKD